MLGFVEGLGGCMMLPYPLALHSLVGHTALKEPNHGQILGMTLQAVQCLKSDKYVVFIKRLSSEKSGETEPGFKRRRNPRQQEKW